MSEQKSKKFVFTVDKDYVSYIESLSYEQKNSLLNNFLNTHIKHVIKDKNNRNFLNTIKKIAIIVFIILLGVPLFLMSINFVLEKTLNSYSKMQQNFERLFDEQNRY